MAQIDFSGRVALVTGAGNGLGKAYAKLLASRGAKVVVNDLGVSLEGKGSSSAAADQVVEEIVGAGGEAVANYDSVTDGAKIVQAALDAYGRIDIIVNNAGVLRDRSFRKMTEKDWDLVSLVHTKGMYSVTAAAWPHFEKQQYGRIVNITSSSGIYGSFGQANYATAKAGVLGFTFTLALEGAKRNIHTNAIAPLGASRMMETVNSPDTLAKLPLHGVATMVAYLCHEDCKSNGGVYELGGHWISKLGWRRSAGVNFQKDFTVEDVADNFAAICDFKEGCEYPHDSESSMAHSIQGPADPAKPAPASKL